jgi:predicted ArsR family transcriptional regulator
MCDNRGAIEEETPAPAGTGRGHGRTEKEFDVTNRTRPRGADLAYLTAVAQDLLEVATRRVTLVKLARRQGATNQDIATALGISEGAVRALLKRHA